VSETWGQGAAKLQRDIERHMAWSGKFYTRASS
jgi:hypothetical protein